jgi:hypothetical protein
MALHDIQHILGEKDFSEMWNQKLKSKFEQDSEGLYYNQKLQDEMIKRKKFTESRKNNLTHKDIHTESHMDSQMENGDINGNVFKNINIPFEDFWNLYDKKTSDKAKTEKKWSALSDSVRSQIMAYVPEYKAATPDKRYRKDPMTFFNNHSWEHEIIKSNGANIKSIIEGKPLGTSDARIRAAEKF